MAEIAVGGIDGLYLCVAPGGTTNWALFYPRGTRVNGKGAVVTHRVSSALYSIRSNYPTVGLKQARELRSELLKGADPVEKHRFERTERIRVAAEVAIRQKMQDLSNLKAAGQWRSTLETYAFPVIGERKIDEITRHDVVKILEPIWRTKTKTATHLRGRIATVFDYAKAMGYCEGENPTAWKGTLEPILGQAQSEPAIDLWRALRQTSSPSETRVSPSSRKGGSRPLTDPTLIGVMKRMGWPGLTQHGFRSTFRDWAGEQTHHAREVIEHTLMHRLKDKVEAAYQRGTLWQKRVALMDDWANYCGQRGPAGTDGLPDPGTGMAETEVIRA